MSIVEVSETWNLNQDPLSENNLTMSRKFVWELEVRGQREVGWKVCALIAEAVLSFVSVCTCFSLLSKLSLEAWSLLVCVVSVFSDPCIEM